MELQVFEHIIIKLFSYQLIDGRTMAIETKILITFIWVFQYQLHANGCALIGSELNWPNATVVYVLDTDLNPTEITLIEGSMNII